MGAIFRREFKTFFLNPIGYVVLAVLLCVSGYYFYGFNLYNGFGSLAGVFSGLFTVSLMVIPFMTMRLFSEEKRQKTDQALLTAPTSLTGIVMGKFFAALLLYVLGISITLVYAVILAFQITPDWPVIIGNYLGLILVGGLVISIGLLISCLTESQVIAALGTLAVSMLMISIDMFASVFYSISWISSLTNFLSVSIRYADFTSGLIHYDNILFFLSLQALFIFLTVRVLDSKRWN